MNEELSRRTRSSRRSTTSSDQRDDELNEVNAFLESILASLAPRRGRRSTASCACRPGTTARRDLWGLRADEVAAQHFLNLDIGLPVEELRAPIRDRARERERRRRIDVEAVNRRGRAIFCRVELAPLHTNGTTEGAILLMTDEDRR